MNTLATLRVLGTAAVFVVTWVLWSGHYAPLLLVLGALSCAAVLWLAVRIGFFDKDVYTLHLGPKLLPFWAWLLKEIALANLAVSRIVLTPRLTIAPGIVTLDVSYLPPISQAILANSITLTPGTLSVDLDDGRIEVHCLTQRFADQLLEGVIQDRAAALR